MSHIASYILLEQRREQHKKDNTVISWLKTLHHPYPLLYIVLGNQHIPSYYKEWENRFYRSREDFYNHFDNKNKERLYSYYQHDIRH